MPFRVLSFDGGPTVSSYVRCLQAIEEARPGFLDRVDLLIGSSAGACTAVFLAGRLTPGADGVGVAAEAVDYADGILRALAPQDAEAYKRLISGLAPLITGDGIHAHLSSSASNFLALPRRVTIQSCRSRAPYDPVVTSNYGADASDEDSVDIVLRSSSLPFWSAPREDQIDGALFCNNPSTTGLLELIASTRGTDEQVELEDVVMLSFGGDDGSSAIANLSDPEDGKAALDPIAALKKLGIPVDAVINKAVEQLLPLQAELSRKLEEMGMPPHPEGTEHIDEWGWRKWLAHPGNLAYVIQVWVSGEGRGAHWQCEKLLGERAFRVAPVGLLSSNEALLALFLGLPEPVIDLSKMTAELWKDPVASQALQFDRSVMDTLDWVDRWWMQDEPAGPRRAATPRPPPPRSRKRDRLLRALQAATQALREP